MDEDSDGGAQSGKGQKFRALKAREVAGKAASIATVSKALAASTNDRPLACRHNTVHCCGTRFLVLSFPCQFC